MRSMPEVWHGSSWSVVTHFEAEAMADAAAAAMSTTSVPRAVKHPRTVRPWRSFRWTMGVRPAWCSMRAAGFTLPQAAHVTSACSSRAGHVSRMVSRAVLAWKRVVSSWS